MKIVEVFWTDSGSVDGLVWHFKDGWQCGVHACSTVGYLVEERKQQIVVAQSLNEDQYGRLFAIPKGCIANVIVLKEE